MQQTSTHRVKAKRVRAAASGTCVMCFRCPAKPERRTCAGCIERGKERVRARRVRAAAAAGAPPDLTAIQERLADRCVREHDYESAAVHYRTALRQLGEAPGGATAVRETVLAEKLGRALFHGIAPLEAERWTRRAYDGYLSSERDRPGAARSALQLAEVMWLGAQTERGIPLLERAVDLTSDRPHSGAWALAKLLLAASLRILAKSGEADAHVDDAGGVRGLREATAKMYLFDQRAIIAADAGHAGRALELFENAVDAAVRAGDVYSATVALDDFAFYATAFGELAVAERCRERAFRLAREHRLGWRTTYLALRLALHYTRAGDAGRARPLLGDALRIFDPSAPPVLRILFYAAGVPAAIALGDRRLLAISEATDGLELAFASGEDDRIVPGVAAATELHRHRHETEAARALLRRALTVVKAPVYRREILQLARDLAAAAPAQPIARRYAALLTPRQLEVAGLLAGGASNKAIAAALHIAENTVESHVTAILARLDLHSRWELRRSAAATEALSGIP